VTNFLIGCGTRFIDANFTRVAATRGMASLMMPDPLACAGPPINTPDLVDTDDVTFGGVNLYDASSREMSSSDHKNASKLTTELAMQPDPLLPKPLQMSCASSGAVGDSARHFDFVNRRSFVGFGMPIS